MTLHGNTASPASCCNCCLLSTWSTWSWRWLAVTALPLPRDAVGWERAGTAFPHLFLAWERVPTPFCTSNLSWRCGIQKITLKYGCALTDELATRRFALLVKSVHSETRGSSVEILVGECSLYWNYLLQFFIWCGNTVPTPLFLALHACPYHWKRQKKQVTTPQERRLADSVLPIRLGRFGLALAVTGLFGQSMNSCRNLTC